MEDDPRRILYIHALLNAVVHENLPKAGTVLGTVIGKYPELRGRAKELSGMLGEVLARVGSLSPEERKAELLRLAPELMTGPEEKRPRKRELPPLPGGEEGVVMRFAPNPSGPLHLGHARAAYLNDHYVRRYGGRYILRIEDTDPRRVELANYQLLLEDIEWLDLQITDVVYQSDRLEIYYDHCRRLIELGGAYVCTCDADVFRAMKMEKKACPCRGRSIPENLELWNRMLSGDFYQGMATVRIRSELDHPDPAMRDFSLIRIVDAPIHPRVEARVYPLMNFSVAVDDHLLGITHVIRGKDHIANTKRQHYIYDYFNWKPPEFLHYGRMSIEDVVLSTSAMKEGIRKGEYSGWDDIRLGTLRAIARRGISPDAVRNAMIDIGIGETDISFSWENLYAQNRAIVDPEANRYFFVASPVLCKISGAPDRVAHPLLHPGDPERGYRELRFSGSVLLPGDEIRGASFIRLKDLFNVTIRWRGRTPHLSYAGDALEDARTAKAPIIQWLPVEGSVPCILHRPDGDIEGFCELPVRAEVGHVVQFERVGFARIDADREEAVTAYFAHR
jgi:glutamyl-tRNA synthetase